MCLESLKYPIAVHRFPACPASCWSDPDGECARWSLVDDCCCATHGLVSHNVRPLVLPYSRRTTKRPGDRHDERKRVAASKCGG